jgi:hypothetical protein
VQAQGPGTLLYDRFGVTLSLLPPHDGGTYNSFDWNSFVPTRNTDSASYRETDWYGNWNTSDFNVTTIQHTSPDGVDEDWYSSGGEWYDVEGIYLDNDSNNLYVVVVTSVPPYKDYGGGHAGFGIWDPRLSVWIRPGDLALDLGLNTDRAERDNSHWRYDYGVDITHDNRDVKSGNECTMRDNNVGTGVWRTLNDAGSHTAAITDPGSALADTGS